MTKYKINKNGEGIIPQGETDISDGTFKKTRNLGAL